MISIRRCLVALPFLILAARALPSPPRPIDNFFFDNPFQDTPLTGHLETPVVAHEWASEAQEMQELFPFRFSTGDEPSADVDMNRDEHDGDWATTLWQPSTPTPELHSYSYDINHRGNSTGIMVSGNEERRTSSPLSTVSEQPDQHSTPSSKFEPALNLAEKMESKGTGGRRQFSHTQHPRTPSYQTVWVPVLEHVAEPGPSAPANAVHSKNMGTDSFSTSADRNTFRSVRQPSNNLQSSESKTETTRYEQMHSGDSPFAGIPTLNSLKRGSPHPSLDQAFDEGPIRIVRTKSADRNAKSPMPCLRTEGLVICPKLIQPLFKTPSGHEEIWLSPTEWKDESTMLKHLPPWTAALAAAFNARWPAGSESQKIARLAMSKSNTWPAISAALCVNEMYVYLRYCHDMSVNSPSPSGFEPSLMRPGLLWSERDNESLRKVLASYGLHSWYDWACLATVLVDASHSSSRKRSDVLTSALIMEGEMARALGRDAIEFRVQLVNACLAWMTGGLSHPHALIHVPFILSACLDSSAYPLDGDETATLRHICRVMVPIAREILHQ